MERTDYNRLTAGIAAATGLKGDPSRKSLDEWFEDVKHIPAEAIPDLKRILKAECKRFPANFAKAVQDAYRKVNSKGGAAVTYRRSAVCTEEHCDDGLLFVWKNDIRCVYRCLACNRSNLAAIPGQHMANLIEAGCVPDTADENYQRIQTAKLVRAETGRMNEAKVKRDSVSDEVEKLKKAHGWA